MEITKINFNFNVERDTAENKIKAYADVTFDDCFVVHSIKVVQGSNDIFIAMPSKKLKSGGFTDIVHPINQEFRKKITSKIIEEYEKAKTTDQVN